MKNSLVVKDNILINASYNLDLVEQRLVLLAILEARESKKGINANSELTIHASSYIETFNVEKHTAYEVLKKACEDLFHRQFSYKFINRSENYEYVRSRWVSKISYVDKEAIVRIVFAPDVIPLITRLEEHFTSYQLKQVAQLSSRYAIRLYELLISWRKIGKTPVFEIAVFREQLGIDEKLYTRIEAFKRRVLEPTIEQLNKYTDIVVKYEQHKKGRSIIGFSFSFKEKKTKEPITTSKSIIKKLTPKQISFFAKKLAHLPEFSKFGKRGEGYDEFAFRLQEELTDPQKLILYKPYLEKVSIES